MVSPSLVLIALVALYPIVYAIWLSLHQYSLLEAGLTRWAEPNAPFGNYTKRSGATAAGVLGSDQDDLHLHVLLGRARAGPRRRDGMAMHSAFKGQGVLRTVVLVPWAILTVVTAITWQTIFEPELGFTNSLLGAVGLPDDTVWLGTSPEALIVMIFADVWKTAPFMALLVLAGLQTIPGEIYEAAKVDGATAWQRFVKITLPLLKPAILVALIFRTLDALRIFDLPTCSQGRAQHQHAVADLLRAFGQNRLYGEGSALAILTFVIVMAVSFLYIRFVGGNLRGLAEE